MSGVTPQLLQNIKTNYDKLQKGSQAIIELMMDGHQKEPNDFDKVYLDNNLQDISQMVEEVKECKEKGKRVIL